MPETLSTSQLFCGRGECKIRQGALGRVAESGLSARSGRTFLGPSSFSFLPRSPERLLLAQVDHEAEKSQLLAPSQPPNMPTMSGRTRPIEKFAEAVSKCSVEVRYKLSIPFFDGPALICLQAAAYGKCVVADYQSVHQDMCAKEFMRLKDCYLVSCQLWRVFSSVIYKSTDARDRKLRRSGSNLFRL